MTIFCFGFINNFSGQTIYEQWLYQFFNITFTSVPIMWYAVFDFEYPKIRLFSEPRYYLMVANNALFTNYKFLRWVFYGVWQSIVLTTISYIPFEQQGGSFWMEGNFVYLGVVLIVNIKILTDTNSHLWVSLCLAIGSILFFLASSVVVNFVKSSELYGSLPHQLTAYEFYYILIFMMLAITQIDIGVNYVNRQIRKRIIKVTLFSQIYIF